MTSSFLQIRFEAASKFWLGPQGYFTDEAYALAIVVNMNVSELTLDQGTSSFSRILDDVVTHRHIRCEDRRAVNALENVAIQLWGLALCINEILVLKCCATSLASSSGFNRRIHLLVIFNSCRWLCLCFFDLFFYSDLCRNFTSDLGRVTGKWFVRRFDVVSWWIPIDFSFCKVFFVVRSEICCKASNCRADAAMLFLRLSWRFMNLADFLLDPRRNRVCFLEMDVGYVAEHCSVVKKGHRAFDALVVLHAELRCHAMSFDEFSLSSAEVIRFVL